MFVRVKSTPNSPRKSVQIVAGFRDATTGKVKQKIIRYVGIAMNDAEEQKLRDLAQEIILTLQQETLVSESKNTLFPIHDNDEALSLVKPAPQGRPKQKRIEEVLPVDQVTLDDIVEEARMIEGIHDVAGHVFDDMYKPLCSRARFSDSQFTRLRDVVMARLADPSSKFKAQQQLALHFDRTHNLDSLYRMMDKVYDHIDMIKSLTFAKTQGLFPNGIEVLLFDVTTLYFESVDTDDLRAFGYSKDHRFNTTQVVLALATNRDGLPIGYELFEGNQAEVGTLIKAINNWKTLFPIDQICFVGDRAMMSKDNIALLEENGYQYVIAAKLKQLPTMLKRQVLDSQHYRPCLMHEQLGWINEFEHNKQRLIVSYTEKRAQKDASDRQAILDKLNKKLNKNNDVKSIVNNKGIKQYANIHEATVELDDEKILAAAQWDGLHGVLSNIKDKSPEELIAMYGRLWRIEESFRINKHTLKMRPIFHFKKERIKAHVAICYMAFSVLRHLEYQVNLTQKLSVNTILSELITVEASIYKHKRTQDKYRVPGVFSNDARKIYKAFNLERKLNAEPYMK
jgi:transposase